MSTDSFKNSKNKIVLLTSTLTLTFITRILEGFEDLALATTIKNRCPHLEINYSPDYFDDILLLLDNLDRDFYIL